PLREEGGVLDELDLDVDAVFPEHRLHDLSRLRPAVGARGDDREGKGLSVLDELAALRGVASFGEELEAALRVVGSGVVADAIPVPDDAWRQRTAGWLAESTQRYGHEGVLVDHVRHRLADERVVERRLVDVVRHVQPQALAHEAEHRVPARALELIDVAGGDG